MDSITLWDKSFVPFIPQADIEKAVDAVAERINADFADSGEIPVLLCVLNGSIVFTAALMQRLSFQAELVSMKLSSYEGTQSTGNVRQVMGLSGSVKDRRVIIVEDIVDTGTTIVDLTNIVRAYGAKEVRVCTLLLKPDVYDKNVPLDYVGMSIPNRFIVGYGLDYNELGRGLKDIYVLDESK